MITATTIPPIPAGAATTPPISTGPAAGAGARPPRLLSLDFMRGLIMVLLALESAGLYEHLAADSEGTILHPFFLQFFHHPWHGLHAWDLVQPAFMFMAGAAMAFSLHRQQSEGKTWNFSFRKALKRSGWLFFWGVLDYAVRPGGLSFELWDVLTQLSFTCLLAFLIFRWSVPTQIAVCAGLLLLTEILYRFIQVPGFDRPFTDQHNFGNYIDWLLMRKINPGGWVAINCIPTAVHTIAGVLAGKLLLGGKPAAQKVRSLLLWAGISLAAGYLLDAANITPIIKRIATTSFVLVSLGYSLLTLAVCYWWIDVEPSRTARPEGQTSAKRPRHYLTFFTIVGMNSIFIYLFFEIVGDRWFTEYVGAVTNGLMQLAHLPVMLQGIITSCCVFSLEWGLCYFLYKKKIFFRV
jgi:predicted acyltransferase